MPRDRPALSRTILLAALAGLILRLVFAFGYWINKPLTRDELEYLSLARSIAHGHGVTYDPVLLADYAQHHDLVPFGRAPGYPAFLALVGGGASAAISAPSSVKAAQCVVGALTVLLIGAFARRLGGDRAGAVSAWLAACYPPLIWICSYALSEALYVPIGLLTALALDWAAEPTTEILRRRASSGLPSSFSAARISWARGICAGVTAGIGLLVRAATILFLPLGVGWLLARRRYRAAAGLILGAVVLILPWTLRNYGVYHRTVLIASDGGVTFWTGNNSHARGEGDMASNPDLAVVNAALRAANPGLTEEEMEPVYYRESMGWIRAHPLEWIALEGRKMFYTIAPIGPSYTVHSRLYYDASLVSYLGVLPLAIAGFLRMRERTRFAGLTLMVLASCAICLIFFPQERFRLAIIDPALVVWAGSAFSRRSTPA